MAAVLESATTGVMSSVMEKLAAVMGEQYEKHKAVRRDVSFLKDELGSMNAVLAKLANMEELDPQTTEWRNQVMGMAFDIEDSIDDFMRQVGDNVGSGDAGFIAKVRQYVNELRVRHHFTKQIQELKSRVIEVSERRKRYKIDDEGSSGSRGVAIDPRVTALYAEAANLVGIDGPMDEIIKLLSNDGDTSVQCLRVVAIVGFGGLGKTTVANEVYCKLGGEYIFKAFVSVSQRPDLMNLLSRIVYKIGMPQLNHVDEVEDVIENVRQFLKEKRYLFVIDDIWDASVWEILRCAFPDNEKGSKVITTTRIETVAKACCTYRQEFIYRMKPLDEQNSKKLFYSRVGYVCSQPLIEIADEILQKCGGLPLAIISIASLLASQPARSSEQWKFVCSSLSSNLRTNPTLEGMRQVLKLSYNNLPAHLKTCLLYIGVYPEDHSIDKECLVRLWVAEGFVGKLYDQDAEEVAESYFNELVNRSMIQPTYTYCNGKVWRCKVHDMILDLIRLKSEEESFLRVIDNVHDTYTSSLHTSVRRLSLHLDFRAGQETKAAASLSMSHIRSFSLFGSTCFMPPLSGFKYIRVINLKGRTSDGDDTIDLTPINKLYQLRYVNVRKKARLPAQIRTLQRLETLDLGKLEGDVPSDIVHLRCLLHLIIPYGKRLPDGICAMKSLHTLRHFDLGMNSVDNFKGLGELTNVRDLAITRTGSVPQQEISDTLWPSIGKLISCKLRTLILPPFPVNLPPPATESDGLTISQAEGHLEILEVSSTMFPQVPCWIGQHHKLSKLALTVNMLKQDDTDLLAKLPNLSHLELNIRKSLKERILIRGGSMAFPVLKYLKLSCFGPWLAFEAGSMPNIRVLELNQHGRGLERYGPSMLEGMEHLLRLREVHVVITNGFGSTARPGVTAADAEVDAEAAYKNALSMHPGHHSIELNVTLFCLVLTPPAFIYDSDDGP